MQKWKRRCVQRQKDIKDSIDLHHEKLRLQKQLIIEHNQRVKRFVKQWVEKEDQLNKKTKVT